MEVLKSKSFQSTIAGFIVLLLVNFVPELADNQEALTTGIFAVIGALIAGHKGKDVLIAWIEAGVKRANVEDQIYKMGEPEAATVQIKKN